MTLLAKSTLTAVAAAAVLVGVTGLTAAASPISGTAAPIVKRQIVLVSSSVASLDQDKKLIIVITGKKSKKAKRGATSKKGIIITSGKKSKKAKRVDTGKKGIVITDN